MILRPLDHSSSPSPGQVPGQEGEQGTLEGALPDSILKVTMAGRRTDTNKLRCACLKRHSGREQWQISPQRPLDDPLPGLPSARPAEEGEQGTLKGALPDPILKITMGGGGRRTDTKEASWCLPQ